MHIDSHICTSIRSLLLYDNNMQVVDYLPPSPCYFTFLLLVALFPLLIILPLPLRLPLLALGSAFSSAVSSLSSASGLAFLSLLS